MPEATVALPEIELRSQNRKRTIEKEENGYWTLYRSPFCKSFTEKYPVGSYLMCQILGTSYKAQIVALGHRNSQDAFIVCIENGDELTYHYVPLIEADSRFSKIEKEDANAAPLPRPSASLSKKLEPCSSKIKEEMVMMMMVAPIEHQKQKKLSKMLTIKEEKLRKCIRQMQYLHHVLVERSRKCENSDFNIDTVVFEYTWLILDTFNTKYDISFALRSNVIEGLTTFLFEILKDVGLEHGGTVPIISNKRLEVISDIIKMCGIEQKIEKKTRKKRKIEKNKAQRRRKENNAEASSSDSEPAAPRNREECLQVLTFCQISRRSSIGSPNLFREKNTKDLKEAENQLKNHTKCDKVIMVIRLIFKLAIGFDEFHFINLAVKFVDELKKVEFDQYSYEGYLKIFMAYSESILHVTRGFRWRKTSNSKMYPVIEEIWKLGCTIVRALILIQSDEDVGMLIYDSIEAVINMTTGVLFEFLYFYSSANYLPSANFAEEFLQARNFSWFNFHKISSEIMESFNDLQRVINKPTYSFYRDMVKFIINNCADIEPEKVKHFLETARPGMMKAISVSELVYVTSILDDKIAMDILARHIEHCDYIFFNMYRNPCDTEECIPIKSNKILHSLLGMSFVNEINLEAAFVIIRELVRCHNDIICRISDDNFDVIPDVYNKIDEALFELVLFTMEKLFQHAELKGHYSKDFDLLLRNYSTVIKKYCSMRIAKILLVIRVDRYILNINEYDQEFANFFETALIQCRSCELTKEKIFTICIDVIGDILNSKPPAKRMQNVRYYIQVLLQYCICQMEVFDVEKEAMDSVIKIFLLITEFDREINAICSKETANKKELFDAKTLTCPYFIIKDHYLKRMFRNETELQIHQIVHDFEKCLEEVIKDVISTDSRNTIIPCLVILIDLIHKIHESEINSTLKEPLFKELQLSIYNIVMNSTFSEEILNLPEMTELKDFIFTYSENVPPKAALFEKSSIDHLTESNIDFKWDLSDIMGKFCGKKDIIKFLTYKFFMSRHAPAVQEHFLDLLLNAANSPIIPSNFCRVSQSTKYTITANLFDGIGFATWINIPQGRRSKIIVTMNGYILNILIDENSNIKFLVCDEENDVSTGTISLATEHELQWHLLTISFKIIDKKIHSLMAVDEHIIDTKVPVKYFVSKLVNLNKETRIELNLSEVDHSVISLTKKLLTIHDVAAYMSMGVHRRELTRSIDISNICSIPVTSFANMLYGKTIIFDEQILNDLKSLEIDIIDSFGDNIASTTLSPNYYQQFIELGGVPALLYLFGKAVLHQFNETIQVKLTKLILNLLSKPHMDVERWPPAASKNVLALLLTSDSAKFDEKLLTEIILHGFHCPPSEEDEKYRNCKNDYAKLKIVCTKLRSSTVCDVEFLEAITSDWEFWKTRTPLFVKLVIFYENAAKNQSLYNAENMLPIVTALLKTISLLAHDDIFKMDDIRFISPVENLLYSILQALSAQSACILVTELWNCLIMMKSASEMYVDNEKVDYHQWMSEHNINEQMQTIDTGSLVFSNKCAKVVMVATDNNNVEFDETDDDIEIIKEIDRKKFNNSIKTDESDNSNVYTSSEKEFKAPDPWQVCIQSVIYDVIIEYIQFAPDNEKLDNDSLCMEVLIVLLTKESNINIIVRIVKMVAILMNHSTTLEDKYLITKSNQFKILAAQLCGKPTELLVANSLFSILLHEDVDISAGLDSTHVSKFAPDQVSCQCLEPIMVIFAESVKVRDDGAMFLHTCAALCSLFQNNSILAQAMVDSRLDDVMVNIIYKICESSTDHDADELTQNGSAWVSFGKVIIQGSFNSGIPRMFQIAENIVRQLMIAGVQESERSTTNLCLRIHNILCILLCELIQVYLVSANAESDDHRSASAPTTPCDSICNSPEDLEYIFSDNARIWTDGIMKFKDHIRNSLQGTLPNITSHYKKVKPRAPTSIEMANRVKKILGLCKNFITISNPPKVNMEHDDEFHFLLFNTLSKLSLDDVGTTNNPWIGTVLDDLRSAFGEYIAYMLFDYHRKVAKYEKRQSDNIRNRKMTIIHKLNQSQSTQKIMAILNRNMNFVGSIQVGLFQDFYNEHDVNEYSEMIVTFMHKFQLSYKNFVEEEFLISADARNSISIDFEMTYQWLSQLKRERIGSLHFTCYSLRVKNAASCDYSVIANQMTRHAVQIQGDTRKLLHSFMEKHFKAKAEAKNHFKKFEKVFGHFGRNMNSATTVFALTEVSEVQGPRGEKLRFNDTTNVLPPQFHNSKFCAELALEQLWPTIPISKANKSIQEGSLFTCNVTMALNGGYYEGVLIFTDAHIYYFGEENKNIEISYANILSIHHRRFELQDLAFEIFMENHSTWFFAVQNMEDRKIAIHLILDRSKSRLATPEDLIDFKQDWMNGKINTFEYLMILNIYSGRTYHDFMQYPVMPHVLSNYESDTLDLNYERNYRNLKLPIPIQKEKMVQRYQATYRALEESKQDAQSGPYHYASLYSNLATVTYYLIRLLPHAKLAIEFQDGSFDCPDRLFHSIESSFRLASGGSATDYKELVPEMFTTPEVFLNLNKMNFGVCQNGQHVNDVVMPKWCNIREPPLFLQDHDRMRRFRADAFILAQRHALESKYVQRNIHDWIDLIFGYKQTGIAAIAANNVYHPAVYPENTPENLDDPILKAAYTGFVRNIGQVPMQLFSKPHAPRIVENTDGDYWSFAGIGGLAVGPQIYQQHVELKEVEIEEEGAFSIIKNILTRGEKESTLVDRQTLQNSTFFPIRENFTTVDVVHDDYSFTVIDQNLKHSVKKLVRQKNILIRRDPENSLIGCMKENGVVDFYKIVRKNFFGDLTLDIIYDGSIFCIFASFKDFSICHGYNSIFTITDPINNIQYISVWDLSEKRFIRTANFESSKLEIFGLLKHTGEMIAAEKSTHSEELQQSAVCKFSINGRLTMCEKFRIGFISGSISQMKPGEGISMIAMICTDFSIMIIETVTLTCVRIIDLTKIIRSPPTRITYEIDGNLLIIDGRGKKWKLMRKSL